MQCNTKNTATWSVPTLFLIISLLAFPAQGELYFSPYIGYTFGGKVADQKQDHYQIKPSQNYALALETPFQTGRIGFFYHQQASHIEQVDNPITIHYLHFQSSIYYPLQSKSSAFIGIGLGGSYTDADWATKRYGFSSSVFAGLNYQITSHLSFTSHARWLGTVVDNDTTAFCDLGHDEHCVIRFRSSWINQVAFNLGVTVRF